MRTLVAIVSVAALGATLLPVSASAAPRHHHRAVQNVAYVDEPVYAAAGPAVGPLLYPVGGAVIGAIIGAAVCPPCTIAGSALTSGGGALLGAGIGAFGGTVVGVAASQPTYVASAAR